ncbi:MAG: hypothetical protein KUG77_21085 [Nannocystaceae bacterium]|nr:hypothetical protein [Nannocystaceae bacterium]
MTRRFLPPLLFAVLLGCNAGDATESSGTDGPTGCVSAMDLPRTVTTHMPLGGDLEAVVTADLRCADSAELTVDTAGRTYSIAIAENVVTISAREQVLISGVWTSNGALSLTSAGGTTVGEPLRSYLLFRASDIADFDSTALALLDWATLSAMLDLDGADPDGNDPATDAEELPIPLRFLQDHPPVFRMEKGDLPRVDSLALVAAMDGMMNDREVIDFHHFELCHLDEQFFTEHDVFVDRMEAQVRGSSPALELPFGRLPWHEPGSLIPEAYATWSDIAEDFYAANEVCGDYPRRICTNELKYTLKFGTPEVQNTWACNPADRANWCEGLLLGHECSDHIGTQPDEYLGCEVGDDGLPLQCPYGILDRFKGERLCEYETVDDLWTEMIDWHGQVHDRIGGAHGDHAMTPTTPSFWLFHVTINSLYEGYLRCP